jgi:hypothetical protein
MTETTFHIRIRLPRGGGNQYYKARPSSFAETFCGAEATSYDVDWRSKAPTWTRDDGAEMAPCVACIAARKEREREGHDAE